MESLEFLAQFLIEKFPFIGVIGAKGVVVVGLVTILIQIANVIVKLTPTPKDDEAVSKIEKVLGYLVPVLKMVPHVNPTPLALKITEVLKRLLRAVKAYSSDEEQK
jgi:acetolactate synthase small subunit